MVLNCFSWEKQKIKRRLHWLPGAAKSHYGAGAYLAFIGQREGGAFLDKSSLWMKRELAHTNRTWDANQMHGGIPFSSYKESVPYTMCCQSDVHCGVWQWWGNTARRYTKADGKRCLLLHVPAAPPSSSAALRSKRWHLALQNPIILHDSARGHTDAGVTDLLRRWQWEILEHTPYSTDMSPCDYDLSTKLQESLRGTWYNTRDELVRAIGRIKRNIKKTWKCWRCAISHKHWAQGDK